MKAIETKYQGYRFRSRLEARWAVFFDALGIRWEYEPEGFELSDGTRYLPDFLIRENGWVSRRFPDLYVEIKPIAPISEPDKHKIQQFAKESCKGRDNAGVLVAMGDPLTTRAYLFGNFNGAWISGPIGPPVSAPSMFWDFWGEGAEKAAMKARSVRFERGERPRA